MSDDSLRCHKNNASHARSVYLSMLRTVPEELLVQEISQLLGEVKLLCSPESDVRRRLNDAQWQFLEE